MCVHVHACECVRQWLSPLVVLCKSLSHPKPALLSGDLIDLHDSVWGAVKKTGSSEEMREDSTIILSKIRRGTAQSHLNKKKKKCPFFGGGLMVLLILHTIGTSLHLPHCRIEIALLIKEALQLLCQGKK